MTAIGFILRNLRFHACRHLPVLLGTALATAVLVGALAVGDSVRGSLVRLARLRLGDITWAMETGERYVRAALADRVGTALRVNAAPVLRLTGVASNPARDLRAPGVQVLGVDARFARAAAGDRRVPFRELGPGDAVVNRRLAERLGLRTGDALVVRVAREGLVPVETPLAADSGRTAALRFRVTGIAGDEALGRFGLRADQVEPHTVFVPRETLGDRLGVPGRANLLVVGAAADGTAPEAAAVDDALRKAWTADDAGLRIEALPGGGCQVRSERIFLDAPSARAAREAAPNARPVLAYFANALAANGRSTPYSFVAAPGAPLCPPDMADDEVIVSDWLAEDLGVAAGDRLTMRYYVVGPLHVLSESNAVFRVRAVVPLSGPADDPLLAPEVPGLSDADTCSDWAPGIPLDLDRLRPKDRAYWDAHRTTPKAFVTLAAAQRLWANRFGSLTAVRYPPGGPGPEDVSARLARDLPPARLGLAFRPVLEEGLSAGRQSTDFGQLFIGLSFFLLAAAVLLAGLLYAFGVEQRGVETGLLLALGFPPRQVRRLLLAEGALVAAVGASAGAAAGIAYNRLVIRALTTVWRGAVGTSALQPFLTGRSVAIGALSGFVVALGAMAFALRRRSLRSIRALQSGETALAPAGRGARLRFALGTLAVLGGVGLAAGADATKGAAVAGLFFGAGSLLLAGGLLLASALLRRLGASAPTDRLRPSALGPRQLARRPGRALAAGGLLAAGVFLVVAVGANRQPGVSDPRAPASGTGGYTFFGELALPLARDLNTRDGQRHYGLDPAAFEGVRFAAMRRHEGDEASCLNLNHVRRPPLLGVPAAAFDTRGAFTFAAAPTNAPPGHPWRALAGTGDGSAVPAVADQAVIAWILGLSVGDALPYVDADGRAWRARLAGALAPSIFQGYVLIGDAAFLARFPADAGPRRLLVDVPAGREHDVREQLERGLQDLGLELTPTAERLAAFNTVTNTYLSIFLALGGLGVLIGTLGWAVIVGRNVEERRTELATLRAVGFTRGALARYLLWEHGLLVAGGLLLGAVAAAVAVWPALRAAGRAIPWGLLGGFLAATAAAALSATALAVRNATRRPPLADLREE